MRPRTCESESAHAAPPSSLAAGHSLGMRVPYLAPAVSTRGGRYRCSWSDEQTTETEERAIAACGFILQVEHN